MSNFRQCDRETPYLLPPSVDEWLPPDHLARFVVEIVEQLDLAPLARQYRGAGSAAYHPSVLLGLLIYGYATGTFGSRRIEQATYESLAFRYIAANTHPDHDTLCTFRKRFLSEIESLFIQLLTIARQMKLLKLGSVALDGTKLHANASRHSALSYGHAQKIEAQLQAEVQALLARAEAADLEPLPADLNIPEELARREARLQAIKAANAELEARAAERYAAAQTDYEVKLKAREEQQLTPVLTTLNALPDDLGEVMRLLADAGYFSAANVTACVNSGIEPLLASGREAHHLPWSARFSEPPPLATPADAIERMKHRLRTRDGRGWYALRKHTVEPVFGIVKSVMGFRQFLLRGLSAVRGAWSLVTMAWNIHRMAALRTRPPDEGGLPFIHTGSVHSMTIPTRLFTRGERLTTTFLILCPTGY